MTIGAFVSHYYYYYYCLHLMSYCAKHYISCGKHCCHNRISIIIAMQSYLKLSYCDNICALSQFFFFFERPLILGKIAAGTLPLELKKNTNFKIFSTTFSYFLVF